MERKYFLQACEPLFHDQSPRTRSKAMYAACSLKLAWQRKEERVMRIASSVIIRNSCLKYLTEAFAFQKN